MQAEAYSLIAIHCATVQKDSVVLLSCIAKIGVRGECFGKTVQPGDALVAYAPWTSLFVFMPGWRAFSLTQAIMFHYFDYFY